MSLRSAKGGEAISNSSLDCEIVAKPSHRDFVASLLANTIEFDFSDLSKHATDVLRSVYTSPLQLHWQGWIDGIYSASDFRTQG